MIASRVFPFLVAFSAAHAIAGTLRLLVKWIFT